MKFKKNKIIALFLKTFSTHQNQSSLSYQSIQLHQHQAPPNKTKNKNGLL